MFKDLTAHTYYPCEGYGNVWLEHTDEVVHAASKAEVTLHEMLVDLLAILRVKRPAWQYKMPRRGYLGTAIVLNKLFVYEGDEQLGMVRIEYKYSRSEGVYEYDNHRIDKKRSRGGYAYTSKVKVAAKAILDEFYPLNTTEALSQAQGVLRKLLSDNNQNATHRYRQSEYDIQRAIMPVVLSRWEEFRGYIPDNKVNSIDIAAVTAEAEQAAEAANAWNTAVILKILPSGRIGLYDPADRAAATSVTLADLPDDIRTKFAMLKLVPDGTVASGVGVRSDDTTFMVFR